MLTLDGLNITLNNDEEAIVLSTPSYNNLKKYIAKM